MSFLRNTDVKKHLGRTVHRSEASDPAKGHEADGDIVTVPSIYQAEPIPVPAKIDHPQKVETV
jgi:hypothetical protein